MDWVYLYTMSRAYLRLSDKEFWTSSPRKIIAMVDKFNEIEISKNPFIDSENTQSTSINTNANTNTRQSKQRGMYIDEWMM